MYQSKKNDKKEIEVKCKNLNTKKKHATSHKQFEYNKIYTIASLFLLSITSSYCRQNVNIICLSPPSSLRALELMFGFV